MKKTISTIVAIGFISSMLVNTAHAGNRHLEILNPLWVPAAILSTLAAAVTISLPQPVVYERRGYSEPYRTVIYEEPRHNRHHHYYERDRAYEGQRHREDRNF
jgi:hypothetical protein